MEYLFYYSKELIKLSESSGLGVINYEKENANKKAVVERITEQKPILIIFNGHGSAKTICGHKNEIIISSDENPEALNGAVTYSLSCSSASKLGLDAVNNGAIAFIGYKFDFAIGKDPDSEATPRMDKIAKYFLEPSNILASNLISGKDAKTAVLKAKEKMMENISYLSTTKDFPEAIHYAPYLYGNYAGLVIRGNEEALI
jgi:hypothetical protein